MDVSDIFYFSSARERGEGSPRRQVGGESVSIENPRRGGGFSRTGAEGLGGLNIYFGAEMSTKTLSVTWGLLG